MKQIFALFAVLLFSSSAYAQVGDQPLPVLPEPLERMVVDGAQVRYLGQVNGLDGWVTIRQGQEQYFYVTPDKENFVMGLLFDNSGRMLTLDQVQNLRKNEGEVLDLLAEGQLDRPRLDETGQEIDRLEIQSPSEQLYADMEASNWIPLGDQNAPVIYSVIDPQCPHCHAFLKDLRKDYIESGRIQVRLVPIGLREETRAQAAFLLAAPNPEQAWFRHLSGDVSALPAKSNVNQQGVQHNLSIVENWRLDVTPFTVYKDTSGNVKIIRGRANDLAGIMNDLEG